MADPVTEEKRPTIDVATILRNAMITSTETSDDDMDLLHLTLNESLLSSSYQNDPNSPLNFENFALSDSPLKRIAESTNVKGYEELHGKLTAFKKESGGKFYKSLDADKLKSAIILPNESFYCRTDEFYAVEDTFDLKKVVGTLNLMDIMLLSSDHCMLENIYNKLIVDIRTGSAKPTLDVYLAWLARAAQCRIADLVPRGEVFPNAERYLHEAFHQAALPRLTTSISRLNTAELQICRVLDLLPLFKTRALSVSDASLLMFAILRLGQDKRVSLHILERLGLAFYSIFACESPRQRELLLEFAKIFPLIAEKPNGMANALSRLRLLPSSNLLCLACLLNVNIHICEQGENYPDQLPDLNENEFVQVAFSSLLDCYRLAIEHVEEENDKQSKFALLKMFCEVVHTSLYRQLNAKNRERLMFHINQIMATTRVRADSDTDDAVLLNQLKLLWGRMEATGSSIHCKGDGAAADDLDESKEEEKIFDSCLKESL